MQRFILTVDRTDMRDARIETEAVPEIVDGEVLVAVDRFAFTANNVTYGVAGDQIGYWQFYPRAEGRGIVPVWGYGDVVASKAEGVEVGERLYGFWPMSSHAVLTPGRLRPTGLTDVSPHRSSLPAIYNEYSRTVAEPAEMQAREEERMLFFPLFATSFVLDDFLADNDFFGAKQVIIGSASSKTGFGLAYLLSIRKDHPVDVVGLTSPRNVAFVKQLESCDQVVTYDAIETLDATKPAVYVDMSGDQAVMGRVHRHFGDTLKHSCPVGITHWDAEGERGELPGPEPQFFFAPAQIEKRNKDWGPGEIQKRMGAAWLRMAGDTQGWLKLQRPTGPEEVKAAYLEMVEGRTSPDTGVIMSLNAD